MAGLAIFPGAWQRCQASSLSVDGQLHATPDEEGEIVAWSERCFGLTVAAVMACVQMRLVLLVDVEGRGFGEATTQNRQSHQKGPSCQTC